LSANPNPSGDAAYRYGYEPPVSNLTSLGESSLRTSEHFDYRAMGITEEHVPDLARMTLDCAFDYDECDDCDEVWAPIHAMRAMCQIGTVSTIEPLIRLMEYDDTTDYDDMNDWFLEEIPDALAAFGGGAIPPMARMLADESMHTDSRWAAARALQKIAEQHIELRTECVNLITAELSRFQRNDPELNGGMISVLLDLKSVESVSVIERAFAANMVDEFIVGDWDDVQVEMGLRPPFSADELREKARTSEERFGSRTRDGLLFDDDDLDDELDDWDGSRYSEWENGTEDDRYSTADEPLEVADDRPRMFMPEDIYTADERRQLARQRNKERKAAEKSKSRQKQNKGRR